MSERLILTLPFKENHCAECTQAINQKPSHSAPSTRYAYDFFNPEGPLEVCASADGIAFVSSGAPDGLSHFNDGFGNLVKIEHGVKIYTLYAHLSEVFVHDGGKVNRGQVIGLEGNTGMAGSRHVHWSLHQGNPKESQIHPSILMERILLRVINYDKSFVMSGKDIIGGKGQINTGGHIYCCVLPKKSSNIVNQTPPQTSSNFPQIW